MTAPPLPEDIDPDVAAFVSCQTEQAVLAPGDVRWLPWPDGVPRIGTPRVSFHDGNDGVVTIKVSWTLLSMRLHARVVSGRLRVDLVHGGALGLDRPVHHWVNQLNAHLESHGKQVEAIHVVDGHAVITKGPSRADQLT